jgi:FkbM family methyltransferase
MMLSILRETKTDCVIDVGANEGQFATELRLLGFRGTILSFEPAPDTFERLKAASQADARWHAFNLALGQVRDKLVLNRMKVSVFDSLRQPSVDETVEYDGLNVVVGSSEVDVERLDELLPRFQEVHGFKRPFLKTDTQGFDLEVFRGASGVHERLTGIQCELSLKRIYSDSPTMAEALKVYEADGFDLAGLFPVHPGQVPIIEMNCYLLRSGRVQ